MLVRKGDVEYIVSDSTQIDAFISSGFEIVEEKTKGDDESHSPAPSTRGRKKAQ